MELKEIKCKNCNATLEVKEKQRNVTCEFCGTKFSVEDTYNKAYDATKGSLDAQRDAMDESGMDKVVKGIFGINAVIFVITIIVFVGIFILMISAILGDRKGSGYSYSSTTNTTITNEETKNYSEAEIRGFNIIYNSYAGKTTGVSVGHLCDRVVTNNKTSDHIITIVYKDIEGTDETVINSIRDSLEDWTYYNISLDYDEIGFVYKATITNIE